MTMHWEQQYRKAVTFSYDDGNEQDEKLLEIFNDYGMKATFHVNTGLDHDHGTWQYRDRLWVHRLNLRDCPSLYRGHEVAVHGSLHQNLTELSPEALEEELGGNLRAITEIFGTRPVGMSYPYGVYNDTVVEKLDKGWDSDVGEGGGRLSTGQKQLISFARAVLADPRIFVLDEATSSIDTQTEQLIQQAIDHLLRDRTSFLIAHRLSTIRKADMILVVRDGRIVEQGTHQELLRRHGYYHDLYSKQFAEESAARILQ